MDKEPSILRTRFRWVGLLAGPLLALTCYHLLPEEYQSADGSAVAFSAAGRATLAAMAWMAVWWLTEAVDVAATALLPLAIFPLMGVSTIKAAAAPYADSLIFLFMGGFIIALSMQKWGLGRRVALLCLQYVGTNPRMMVAAFMLLTAAFSAFVSNTATAAMMLPIAMSVIALVHHRPAGAAAAPLDDDAAAEQHDPGGNFARCLMLGIAYSASIGGIATIIGTPPNGILVGFVRDRIAEPYRTSISFDEWLWIGGPLVVVFLPLTWLILTHWTYPIRVRRIEGGKQLIAAEYALLGRPNRGQIATFVVFLCTATLWIGRPWFAGIESVPAFSRLSDPGIAMLGAMALFVIPVNARRGEFVMDWRTARTLPWGVLILFGGGLSLADAVQANGVAEFLGSQMTGLAGVPPLIVVLAVTTVIIFLTELTSNTATTATMLPVLAGLAPGLGVHPYLLIFPAALAASCAFMMPVATPPNAIVFATGHVTVPQMCRAGLWLNLVGILLITALTYLLLEWAIGVDL